MRECAAPDRCSGHESLSARPFVAGEEHRTVLDSDPDAMILGKLQQRSPDFEKARPIVVHAELPVPADEGGYRIESEQRRGSDDFAEMCETALGRFGVGVEEVRI